MIKYIKEDTSVTFAEIPDEICLSINLSCCPHKCPGCHSAYLQKDIGDELNESMLDYLINKNQGITCVLFLGGDNDKERLKNLAKHVSNHYDLLIGWYSGEMNLDLNEYGRYFDYIKVGPYVKERGPLNSQSTNQRLYFINRSDSSKTIVEDITSSFWV